MARLDRQKLTIVLPTILQKIVEFGTSFLRHESAEIKRGKALGLIERIDFNMTRDRVEAIDEKLVELEKRFNEVDREFKILLGTGPSIKPVPKPDQKPDPVQVTQVKVDASPTKSAPTPPTKKPTTKAPPPVPEKKSATKTTPPSPKKQASQPPPPPSKKAEPKSSPAKPKIDPKEISPEKPKADPKSKSTTKSKEKSPKQSPAKSPPKAPKSPSKAPQPSKRTTSLAPLEKPTKRDLDSDDHDTYYDDDTTFK